MSALEVLMGKNASAHDGQIGIRAKKVVRELLDEAEQLVERRPVNEHRRMLGVHDDRVFIVIDIRRILKPPRPTVHGHGHDAQILPRRVRDRARIANILHAEQAFRITGRFFQLCRRNISGVFLRLREVDGNFQLAVLRVGNPVLILLNPVAANVVTVLAELIEIIRRLFRAFCIQRPELPHHLRRARRDTAHEPRVEQIALCNGVVDQAGFCGVVAEKVQAIREIVVLRLLFIALELQLRKQAVPRKCLIKRVQQLAILRVIEQ